MMYPLVRELAVSDDPRRVPVPVPVAVTCRVLGLARQPYYRWLVSPVTDAELTKASGPTPCSTPTATIPSSATASSSTRPGPLAR
ncbi:hypothetical protein EES47_29975 [Streptomyces sp. ADI98-12]|nr:hypothetical protein EES47_29975 [Streptomyces sp. ADI98-12]